jgi:hypothetical protein
VRFHEAVIIGLAFGLQEQTAVDGLDDGGLATLVAAADELKFGVEIDRDILVQTVVAEGDLLDAPGGGSFI